MEIILLLALSFPLIAGFFAKRMGRRFWLWFFIGLVLPVIASVILFLLPDLSETGKKKD